jgi:hypothetical protein
LVLLSGHLRCNDQGGTDERLHQLEAPHLLDPASQIAAGSVDLRWRALTSGVARPAQRTERNGVGGAGLSCLAQEPMLLIAYGFRRNE